MRLLCTALNVIYKLQSLIALEHLCTTVFSTLLYFVAACSIHYAAL